MVLLQMMTMGLMLLMMRRIINTISTTMMLIMLLTRCWPEGKVHGKQNE